MFYDNKKTVSQHTTVCPNTAKSITQYNNVSQNTHKKTSPASRPIYAEQAHIKNSQGTKTFGNRDYD